MRKDLEFLMDKWIYSERCNMQSAVRDILTDLRHIAQDNGVDFDEAVEGSEEVFKEEEE